MSTQQDYLSVQELVAGIRYFTANCRVKNVPISVMRELRKAHESSHVVAILHFLDKVLDVLNYTNQFQDLIGKDIERLIELAKLHPNADANYVVVTDQMIVDGALNTVPAPVLLAAMHNYGILVDEKDFSASISDLASLPMSELEEKVFDLSGDEDEDRMEMMKRVLTVIAEEREEENFKAFFDAMKVTDRDLMLAALGNDVGDEDYEELVENYSATLIAEGIESFQFDADWIDWDEWEPKDSSLIFFEAFKHAFDNLEGVNTNEQPSDFLDDSK